MSGHSHWAKIKRSKGTNDARRGREWSKLARKIIVAARAGGGSIDENLTLRYAVDDAKAANMPKDTIQNAIKKGTGELGTESYEPAVYEGYGAAGVAFIVECLTNNRARTAPEMRKLFERGGGAMGATGSVGWMFEQKGTFVIASDKATEDQLMEVALEAGAEDVTSDEGIFEVICQPTDFAKVRQALADHKIETVSAEIAMVPKNTIAIGEDKARQVIGLMEALEDHEDVQNVYANFDIPEETLEKASK